MKYLYGDFTPNQIAETKKTLHKSVHWLLRYKEPANSEIFRTVDVDHCFDSLLRRIAGLNELLLEQPIIVSISSILQAARMENQKDDFNFEAYRKLILDAHSLIDKIKEDDDERILQKTSAP